MGGQHSSDRLASSATIRHDPSTTSAATIPAVTDPATGPPAVPPARQEAPAGTSGRILGTAVHTLRALELFAQHPRGVTAKAIAHRLGVSLSSAYGLINSLRSEGFVEPSPAGSGLFTLSGKVIGLYQGFVEASAQPERLEPFLEELRDRTRARAYAALWKRGDLEVVQILGRRGTRELHDVSTGFRGAAHALALGKLYLSALGEEHWPGYLRPPILKRFSHSTITSRRELRTHLDGVGRRQIAFDREEYQEGSCCVAAPVRDVSGRLVATLGLSVPAQRFKWDHQRLARALQDVSEAAAAELAFRQGMIDPLAGALPRLSGDSAAPPPDGNSPLFSRSPAIAGPRG